MEISEQRDKGSHRDSAVAEACRLMTADHDRDFWLGRRRLTEALKVPDLCTNEELLSALAAHVAKGAP